MNPSTLIASAAGLLLWTAALQPCSALVTESSDAKHTHEAGLQKTLSGLVKSAPMFPYWRNMGVLNQSTGVYMGNGYVLSAAHVGPGVFALTDGSTYRPIPGSERRFRNPDGSYADLSLFRVAYQRGDSLARLPSIPMRKVCPGKGCTVLLVGAGSGNAARDPEKAVNHFRWNENSRMRWGLNRVEYAYEDAIETFSFRTPGFSTRFSRGLFECQATPGDSGGAVFAYNPMFKRWELCGIILAVDGTEGEAAYGNQTYIADLTIVPRRAFSTNAFLASW